MDKKTRPATGAPSADAEGDEAARLAAFLFGEEPADHTQVPSANAADDEAARSSALLFVDEAGVTRPATETPSSYAARMFGEEAARIYGVMGRLLHLKRLPVGDLSLITVGFRITDRPKEKWTRRFNQFKYGEPAAARAATRTFCAAFEDFLPPGTRASSSSPRSLPGRILCNTTRRRRYWRPRLQNPVAGSGFRISLPRTGIPSGAERDATVDGVYLSAPIGGEPGLVVIVDDFCTRGATLADITRAIRESNPGWKVQGASLAKAERAAYWKGELTNAHIPDELDAIWRGDRNAASPFY